LSSVRRSLWYSFADNHVGMLLQLASSLVIARLLTPGEIGIFMVAAVFAALASTFRDFGVVEYLIQAKDLTPGRIRAAFGVNLMVSWFIAAVMFLSSDSVAAFYGQPGVGSVMRVQALNFVLIPFGAITMAYHRRNMNYRPLFLAGLYSNLVGLVVVLVAVLAGQSYMSMAWSTLAGVVVFVLVSFIYRPAELPRWPALAGIGEVFHFGKHAVGIYLLGQLGKSAPEAVIGRVLDMPSVAYFGRADGLVEIFRRAILSTVGKVCLPFFSEAVRSGKPLHEAYIRAVELLIGVGWPFLLCMGIAAEGIIRLLYGPQWGASVPLAHIICAAAIVRLPYALATEALIAAGNIKISHKLQWLNQTILIASLGLIFPFGLKGACWGLLISAILNSVLSHLFLKRIIGINNATFLQVFRSASIVAIPSATPALLLALIVNQGNNFLWFVPLAMFVSVISWLWLARKTLHPVQAEIRRVKAKWDTMRQRK
jgi:O-antigen/teichoic acid export membrane protein